MNNVDPFFRLKSPGFICLLLLFCSQMSLPSKPLGWTLHVLQPLFPIHFKWHSNSSKTSVLLKKCPSRQNLLEGICMWTLLMKKPITYRLEFLKRLHKSLCSPPWRPGIFTGSQRQTELATKPVCRSLIIEKDTSDKFIRCRLLPAIGSLAYSRMLTDLINPYSKGLNWSPL